MKRIFALLLALLCLILPAAAETDPVVTQSYLEEVFLPPLREAADAIVSRTVSDAYRSAFRHLAESYAEKHLAAVKAEWASGKRCRGSLVLKKGDVLSPLCGCSLTVSFGTVTAGDTLIDVTDGAAGKDTLTPKHRYLQASETAPELTVTSETAELTVSGALRIALSDGADYPSRAVALGKMGLFRGRTLGYDLDSGATRAEGLVMFLRLVGREEDALACGDATPFLDVPQTHWSYPYVAYAYTHGLTNGTSQTAFSPDAPVTAQHYLTFLMRALNCEEGTDFTWDTVLSDVVRAGMFTETEVRTVSEGAFLRSRMAYLSYGALFCQDESDGWLLCDKLISDGVMTADALCDGIAQVLGARLG